MPAIWVSQLNYEKIIELTSKLMSFRKKMRAVDDAITYLFENQIKVEKQEACVT